MFFTRRLDAKIFHLIFYFSPFDFVDSCQLVNLFGVRFPSGQKKRKWKRNWFCFLVRFGHINFDFLSPSLSFTFVHLIWLIYLLALIFFGVYEIVLRHTIVEPNRTRIKLLNSILMIEWRINLHLFYHLHACMHACLVDCWVHDQCNCHPFFLSHSIINH